MDNHDSQENFEEKIPEEFCTHCDRPIYSGEGRYRIRGEKYVTCEKCGENRLRILGDML